MIFRHYEENNPNTEGELVEEEESKLEGVARRVRYDINKSG